MIGSSNNYKLGQQNVVVDRKQQFEKLNIWIMARDGWLVSVPGDPHMRFEALPGSTMPAELRQAGYEVTEIGSTQRILPHVIEQKFTIGTGGELELATAGSTRAISQIRTHAGIVTTKVFDLRHAAS
jgi:hypothetical protein